MDSLDLSIFEFTEDIDNNECDASKSKSKSHYSKCLAMSRLITGFKYYSLLNIITNENDREIFAHFMIEVYRNRISDDYIHFQDDHSDALEQIQKHLMDRNGFSVVCSIGGCKYALRHHRMNDIDMENDKDVLDGKLTFYKDIMDGLHFHLFHCFEIGLRIKKEDDDHSGDEKSVDIDYFDKKFARINDQILKRQHLTASFDRFTVQNSKFSIATQDSANQANDDKIYCDEIFKYLFKLNVESTAIKELLYLMKNEQYDTDSIKFDESIKPCGNICKRIQNQICCMHYAHIVKKTKLLSSTFAIGFRFYYWIYYKNMKKLSSNTEYGGTNMNDHSGYDVSELFIDPKYDSLKEEISNNKHIPFRKYQKEIVVKVNEYQQSERVKKMNATEWGTRWLHYGIKHGDPIRFCHLLSLVLYTDWTDLCTEFSSTFRRRNIFETLQDVIKRNMEYYWMSKCLRECVEIFGQCYFDEDRWKNDYMRGPYYCGISVAMSLSSFCMRLCSPTSTSKHLEVAMKFSGQHGMVIQLNNPGRKQDVFLHGFNASWISRYKEEDERLFFGGFHRINIESVRIRSTKQNFEKFMYSLYYLNTILTGGLTYELRIHDDDVFIIDGLMNNILNKNAETTKRFDDYLYSTFDAFILKTTHIVLRLYSLHLVKSSYGIRDLLMNVMEKGDKERKDEDMTNLFKPELLNIFKNIQSIIIDCSLSFSISMVALLSVIESGSVQQVTVSARKSDKWMYNVWSSSSEYLTNLYQDRNYAISLEETDKDWIHCFMITKTK